MAKKKAVKSEDLKEDELDEFIDEFLENDEAETVFPKTDQKEKSKSPISNEEELDISEIPEEELEFELEEPDRFPEYKYLNLKLKKGESENDFELVVEGQSHGFCNILVKHLLSIEGVNIAAYKATNIYPAQVYIRLENSKYNIKDILNKGIESLREEVIKTQKLFKKLT
ncbi:MAG: RpoL/Rpb11 RNA polymerase subunit family protein [Promethearchaeota archaeon]